MNHQEGDLAVNEDQPTPIDNIVVEATLHGNEASVVEGPIEATPKVIHHCLSLRELAISFFFSYKLMTE